MDGKASPMVGAVLVKNTGNVELASRGELRLGDHAEFTLLERKNRSERLDGTVLFTTLEPCAPGSRSHPKLSCAERIVLARIKEVWIGIEDPDPTVDRKGIKFLEDSGVRVHMFDRGFQEVIQEVNRDFIDQALERSASARMGKKREPIVLSGLEDEFPAAVLGDLHRAALEGYRAAAGVKDKTGSAPFRSRLVQQGIVVEREGRFVPTGWGLVLFGKEPRAQLPQAALLGTIHYGDGREETRDFDGPAVFAPEDAIQWLRDKLPNPNSRTEARRKGVHDALYEVVREGIVNALVHRDYGIVGAKCQLAASPEKIVVKSPGLPVSPITMEQLRTFDAPMLSRNPMLHFVFAKMKLAEERGLGLASMRSRAADAGLPLPTYSFQDPYVVLTLHREAASALPTAHRAGAEQLSEAERLGWSWIVTRTYVTTSEYEKAMSVPNRTAKRQLQKLTELGLLRMVGSARATRYEVVRS